MPLAHGEVKCNVEQKDQKEKASPVKTCSTSQGHHFSVESCIYLCAMAIEGKSFIKISTAHFNVVSISTSIPPS
jgi:hypothetical protein